MIPDSMEDYFADAVERLMGGEALDEIVADYPVAARQELQALLAVVELADQVAAVKPPQQQPVKRIAARVEFSKLAAVKRAELHATQTPLTALATKASPDRLVALWRRFTAGWSSLGAPAPVMRLAPLTLLLLVLYLSTFTVVATAQAALPGDLAYPVKSWIREQRVATAPVEQKAAERWRADQEQAQDVAARAEQLQSEPDAAPLTAVSILQFRGFDGEQLLLGDLKVIPWYRPEGGGEDVWLPITIDGELQPGAVVMLRYQIVPGASDAVQGIALSVMQAPPMPTPAPTATPATARHCQRIQAPNWVAYVVRAGETLSGIAARSQTSVSELRRVNCLTDGILRAGTTIFVPNTILGALPPAPPPAVATAIATLPLPTATAPTPTITPSPPTSAPTITPNSTEAQGGGAEATPTMLPDAGTPTVAPTADVTAEMTPENTTAPTATPVATETVPPVTTSPVATDASPAPTGAATEPPVATTTEPPVATTTEPPVATATEPPPMVTESATTATSPAPDAAGTVTAVAPAAQNTVAPAPVPPTAAPAPVPPTAALPTATPLPPTPVPPTAAPPTATPLPPTLVPSTIAPTDAPAGEVAPVEAP
ncbi:MAG TPA: hypothetical protein DCL15_08470 [Chloroflexi bacterium]|nr:hypothetical protein [Chloroflexota bacterium]HHW86352.1 LysM peptidoglycan-binding domain-containing protein [Chloroflexota bacterium]